MIQPLTSRPLSTKFVICLVGLLCLTLLCALGRIDGTQYLTGFGLVIGIFTVANVKARQDEITAARAAAAPATVLPSL